MPAGVYYPSGGSITYNAHTWLESLLPYIEAQGIYDRLDFRKPTDAVPNSTALLEQTISACLVCPSDIFHGGRACRAESRSVTQYRPGGTAELTR